MDLPFGPTGPEQWLLLFGLVLILAACISGLVRWQDKRADYKAKRIARLHDLKHNYKVESCSGRWYKRANNIMGR